MDHRDPEARWTSRHTGRELLRRTGKFVLQGIRRRCHPGKRMLRLRR